MFNSTKLSHSPHFHYGKARNHPMIECLHILESYTPAEQSIIESYSSCNASMLRFFAQSFLPHKHIKIPSIKSDIKKTPLEDSFVWLGHSSYILWLGGKSIVFDPVLEGSASPMPFMFMPFRGADIFRADDLGEIDYLIITHNHYDHLSKKSICALQDRVKCAIVPLGIGKYLHCWGIEKHRIVELDWEEHICFDTFRFYCLPTRHYAARGLRANTSLWACFVIAYDFADSQNPKHIFCSGDSGYGGHFKAIGEKFRHIDFAFIENGQYNPRWKQNHLFPHQSLQAGVDLGCKKFMPIHNSKFALAPHNWKQPLQSLYALYKERQGTLPFMLVTPRIGEITPLWEDVASICWWEME